MDKKEIQKQIILHQNEIEKLKSKLYEDVDLWEEKGKFEKEYPKVYNQIDMRISGLDYGIDATVIGEDFELRNELIKERDVLAKEFDTLLLNIYNNK